MAAKALWGADNNTAMKCRQEMNVIAISAYLVASHHQGRYLAEIDSASDIRDKSRT